MTRVHQGQVFHWVFQGTVRADDGTKQYVHYVRLDRMKRTAIRRYVKIQGNANPFDRAWEPYFEARAMAKMRDTLCLSALMTLWRTQQSVCRVCRDRITAETGWHRHHIVWKVNGGTDTYDNLVLLHPQCHQQLYANPSTISVEALGAVKCA